MNGWKQSLAGAALAMMPLLAGAAPPPAPPPTGGTIALVPKIDGGDVDASAQPVVDAASVALTARGFTILDDPEHAAYTAQLAVTRTRVGLGLTKDPNGAKPGFYGGLIVPFSTGKSNEVPLVRTRLELTVHARGQTSVVWTGTAVTVRAAGTPEGTDSRVATDLIRALVGRYPVQPRDVIGVP